MASPVSSISTSLEVVPKIGETSDMESVVATGHVGSGAQQPQQQQQQASPRMVPLLYIQGPSTSVRMGSSSVSPSAGIASSTTGTQKVSNTIRSGSTLVAAGTQLIPTINPKLGVTQVINSTSCTNSNVINKTSTNSTCSSQQHIVIQSPRNSVSSSSGTPTIVPVTGKSIAYLGTIIKPGVGKTGESQIVLPAGQIVQNPNQKLVLANVPLSLPQLSSASVVTGSNSLVSQQPPSNKVTSLLVPMSIPTQSTANKGGMINLKIANGHLHTEGGGKSSVTFVREKPLCASTSGQMPPLQPIAKLASKSITKSNGILLTDATLTPINPAILSKSKFKAVGDCDTDIENTRNHKAEEKKKRSQDLNKCLQEAVDAIFCSSPKQDDNFSELQGIKEEEKLDSNIGKEIKELCDVKIEKDYDNKQEEMSNEIHIENGKLQSSKDIEDIEIKKDLSTDEDDEVTLIKVLPSKTEELKKQESGDNNEDDDDDVKIELVKFDTKLIDSPIRNCEDFDPKNVLEWKDGIGTLPGSTLKFRMNEFGMIEMVDNECDRKSSFCNLQAIKKEEHSEVVSIEEESQVNLNYEVQNGKKIEDIKKSEPFEDKPVRKPGTSDVIYYCEGCGCYGLASEFVNTRFCSSNCISAFSRKKAAQTKRERELLQLRLRRRKKRLLQLLQLQKAQQELEMEIKESDKNIETEKKDENIVTSPPCSPTPLLPLPASSPSPPSSPIPLLSLSTTSGMTSLPPGTEDDNSSSDATQINVSQTRLPWQMGKSGFSWPKYLEHCKAKAAPIKLFKDPFPYSKNGFRVGMKLEGIDPEHPSYFCVLTVTDIQGYRIRLHFDGYSESHDFWVNADSMDIFPPGWCEKNNHILHPPRGYSIGNFNWANYLKQSKAQAAPRHLFMNKTGNAVCPHGFRMGMKLEAVDRKNSSLVCVASVSDLMDNRILVHFDSWDDIYDYWADPSSPFIHPVGWCEEHGHVLTPPNNYKGQPFSWDTYLKETKSTAAPARAFKLRPTCGFRRGMKLECVDKWVPMLIRVCSVVEVADHQIKIHFDGWPEHYSYWVDDNSSDIYPMGWCQKTGHPLEPPLTWDDSTNNGECSTPGCRGLGNARGPKFMTHNAVANCPYALQNLHRENIIPDRLIERGEVMECKDSMAKENEKNISPARDSKPVGVVVRRPVGRPPKNRRVGETPEESKAQAQDPDWRINDDGNYERKRKKRRNPSGERSISPLSTQVSSASATPPVVHVSSDLEQLQQELHQSVMQPGYEPNPNHIVPYLWTKHSQYLNSFIIQHKGTDASQWTQDDVVQFVTSIPGCENKAKVFSDQQIDGEALLMMAQEDLVNVIGMKLGPAIKLYNSIVLLRQKVIGSSN